MQNYYQTLEAEPDATFAEIKAAYRKKALLFHPDRGGSHAQMVRINEAWEVLSNPELRSQYDESLKNGDINGDQFAGARRRSQNYARDWKSFDSWLSSIERDFASAKFGSRKVFGMEMPTASGSISAWIFLITGGLMGLLLWVTIYVSATEAWSPKEKASTQTTSTFLPGMDFRKKQNKSPNPLSVRITMLTLFASVAGGAWSGRWAHQQFGATIANWLPKDFSFPFFASMSPALASDQESNPDGSRDPTGASRNSTCPQCEQKIRLPHIEKAVRVTCPKCGKQFDLPHTIKNPKKKAFMKFPPDKQSLALILRGLLVFEITSRVIVLGIGVFESIVADQTFTEMGIVPEFSDLEMFSSAVLAVALVILFPMAIASWIGLYLQKNWARWLYLLSLVLTHLLSVFVGFFTWTYRWGLVEGLESISGTATGLILAICFLSPLATEFVSGSENSERAQT